MRTCIQCGQPCRFWHRDLFTGVCAKCALAPSPVAFQTAKHRVGIVAILALIVVVVGLLSCTPLLDILFFDQPFAAEAWRKGDSRTRGLMVRDLLRSGLLRGKTVAEIEIMLGPGDESGIDFIGTTPGYRVDIGYRWLFQPVLYTLWVRRPLSKFHDETTNVSLEAMIAPRECHPQILAQATGCKDL
jgi:hypothetical protein